MIPTTETARADDMRNRSVRMSDELWERLRVVAAHNHRDRAGELRLALERHCAAQELAQGRAEDV